MSNFTVGSLFSGAGGFDVGFDRAGFDVAWQCEIDATARSVLARHWPHTARFPDVREVGKRNLAPVDVVVGGFPCQDLSTAGKRKGFKGERSSLFFEMARVIDELQPSYVVWENVPGLMSSEEGRDFLAVFVELDRLGFDGGWRTVDAQFFGVPQQRRRVFGVFARRHLGAERPAEILALAESGRRRTPPRRKAGEGTPRIASLGAGGSGIKTFTEGRHAAYDESPASCALRTGGGGRGASNLVVFGGGDTSGERGADAALTAKNTRQDFDTENFVLIQDARSGIAEKSQGGFGVRVSRVYDTLDTLATQAVLVPCLAPDATPKGRADGLAYTLTSRKERGHGMGMAVCVTGESVTHALTAEGHDASEDGTGRGTPIVVTESGQGWWKEGPASSLRSDPGGMPAQIVVNGPIVRRLTPRECERLMGWPDDHTRYRDTGKEIADGPRYRMCGNGVVGTVAEWIARRLMAAMKEAV